MYKDLSRKIYKMEDENKNPLISVITVCLNSEKTLANTIESVISQTYKNKEYIIMDGNSTDGTIELAKKMCEGADFVKIFSEPDDGTFYAMNKAIDKAQGEYIIFINADDKLYDCSILEKLTANLDKDTDILYGDMEVFDTRSSCTHIEKQDNLSYGKLIVSSLYHPCLLVRKKLFTQFGNFDTTYKITADYDWGLRMLLKHKAKIKYIPVVMAQFAYGSGLSSSEANREQIRNERQDIYLKYFGKREVKFFTRIYKTFRSITKIPIVKFFLNLYKRNRINFVN